MSSTYWTAFNFADHESRGRSQRERHRAFIEVVSNIASTAVWTETPHFVLFDSHQDIDSIADHFRSVIDDGMDLFVVVSTLSKAGRIVGANRDDDIFKLMSSMELG